MAENENGGAMSQKEKNSQDLKKIKESIASEVISVYTFIDKLNELNLSTKSRGAIVRLEGVLEAISSIKSEIMETKITLSDILN